MAEGQRYRTGGIKSLLALIEAHGEALEADLINVGLRLRDCPSRGFDWRDLVIFVRHRDVESNLYRSMHPDEAGWTKTNHLLATIADVLRWLQWAKTSDGRKNRNHPEPIPRPGASRRKRVQPKVKAVPRSKIRALLGRKTENRAQKLANLFGGKGGG